MVLKNFTEKIPHTYFYDFLENTKCIWTQTASILENLQQTSQREFSEVFSLKIWLIILYGDQIWHQSVLVTKKMKLI